MRACFLFLLTHLLLPGLRAQTAPVSLTSPDKNLTLRFSLVQNRVRYAVEYRGRVVIEPSALGLQLNEQEVGPARALAAVEPRTVRETYATRGVHSTAANHYNAAAVAVSGLSPAPDFRLEARVFNDGVALRYVLAARGPSLITAEATEFTIPAGSTVWSQPDVHYYEGMYQQRPIEEVAVGLQAGPPLTVRLPDKQAYLAITEGGLTDFAGISLLATGPRTFRAALAGPTQKTGPVVETPWRIIEVGANLNTLVNCDIVQNVSAAPDAALFPQGMATSWLQPGRSVWSWLAGNGGVTFENMKNFSRLAGELGFEYNLVDEGWSSWHDGGKAPMALLKELVDYSAAQKVKVWVWKAYPDRNGVPGLHDAAARRAFFKQCQEIGVAGLKIDFFDSEKQEIIDFYQAALHDAAEMHLMLDFHGANKPTGEARTWPNELSREAVQGLENGHKNWPLYNTTVPFTRYLAGHADYTPLTFGPAGQGTTLSHQVATVAAFTSPLMCLAANPETILTSKARAFITAIPTVWDETIVLPQSEISELVLLARRHGPTWYLVALNGPTARQVTVDLGFLGPGRYQAATLADDSSAPEAALIGQGTARRSDARTLILRAGGGFLGKFTK